MFCTECGVKNLIGSKFCSSCGKRQAISGDVVEKVSEPVQKVDSLNASNFHEVATTINVTFYGKDGDELSMLIGKSLGVKEAYKLVFNLYASNDFFVVLPVSKDKRKLALFGLLLGGGGLAAGAMAALEVFAKKLELKQSKFVMEQDNPLYSALIFNAKDLILKVKETRTNSLDLFDIFKKETWMMVSGVGTYKNKEFQVNIKFGFEGQASDNAKKRITILDELSKALGITAPAIHVGKNPPF